MSKPIISVIGLGFVGLSLAAINAQKGFHTIGIDKDLTKLRGLKKGNPDFYEPKLRNYLKKSIRKKTIRFTNKLDDVLQTDITFVTVGTPPIGNGKIDLSQIKSVVSQLVKSLAKKKCQHLVAIKSTVVPTTTTKLIYPKFKKLTNVKLVVNPEFLREGSAICDLTHPHLIVVGEENKKAGDELLKYYKAFYKKMPEVLRTNFTTVEMIKYSNNAFLATKISFINSIANICQNIPTADVKKVAKAIGKDPRIGSLFLNAGPGFGGSCLPKDLSALIEFSQKFGNVNILLKAVEQVNEMQPHRIIEIMKKMGTFRKNKVIAVLGVAFKKNTDDIRDSTSIPLVKTLVKNGLKVKVHDPMAMKNFMRIFDNMITYCDTVKDCLTGADCCIIMTEWDEYNRLRFDDFKKNMRIPNVIDSRRILDPEKFSDLNFHAIGLGVKK